MEQRIWIADPDSTRTHDQPGHGGGQCGRPEKSGEEGGGPAEGRPGTEAVQRQLTEEIRHSPHVLRLLNREGALDPLHQPARQAFGFRTNRQVLIPTEEVVELQRAEVTSKHVYAGYVLVEMK